jgi:serine/threonine protein kinase
MSDQVGKTIASYQIVDVIYDTERTVVYKGRQPSEDRYVAVEVLKPEAAKDQAVVQSFTRYARLAASMQHPIILPVQDSGRAEDIHYLVTPYMEFRSVADLRSSYADLNQVSTLIGAIIPGLDYIYTKGVVHGNLKPNNIFLSAQNQPLLTDFGLALGKGEAATPYTSPEQVQGAVVDRRTDVYALGALLYTLLAGQAPTPGTAAGIRSIRPDVPQTVEQVIGKAMAQNPDQRYQSPGEFHVALINALKPAPAPIEQQPTAPPPQPQAPAKKGTNWTSIIVGALLVIVLCLVVVVFGPRIMEAINPQQTQPAIIQPIEPPAEQPPAEQPPAEPPAEQPAEPEQLPAGDEERDGLDICGSLGIAGGIVFAGGAFKLRRRKRS